MGKSKSNPSSRRTRPTYIGLFGKSTPYPKTSTYSLKICYEGESRSNQEHRNNQSKPSANYCGGKEKKNLKRTIDLLKGRTSFLLNPTGRPEAGGQVPKRWCGGVALERMDGHGCSTAVLFLQTLMQHGLRESLM